MQVHHYGFATGDLSRSVEVFRWLGYEVSTPVFDPVQKVQIAFVSRPGERLIELVCDSGAEGPTKGFLSKVGSGLYHICYEVDNLEKTIGVFRAHHFLLRHPPVEATAFAGRRIAWLFSRDVGLIELLEK